MRENTTITEDEEGKHVVNSEGQDLGRVVKVRGGALYVDPDPDLSDTIKSKLGWENEPDEDDYRIGSEHVESITDDEVRLNT